MLKPEDLKEADTDVSSVLKFNGHAETVQKVWDVVKKTAYGVDFVLWGLENQERIHYAMPLRHMIGDCFSYLKEYAKLYKGRKQTVKRAADNKRRYAPGEGSIPPVLLSGVSKGGALFGTRLCLQSVVCYTCWRG